MIYLKTSIGIELRGADMLISALQSNFSGHVFTCFKRFPDFRQRNKQDLQQEINLFFKSNRLSRENIVLGIPRKDLVLRHLDLPVEVEDNLKQVVQYQVQSLEPIEEDKFYYDYALLGNKGTEPKKRLSVLLAMVRKAVLDDHLEFLRELGIKPAIVTAKPLALANIFLQNRKDFQDKTFMLADLGPASVEVICMHRGIMAYSREVPKEDLRSWGDLILLEVDEAASKIRLGPDGAIEKIVLSGETSGNAHDQLTAVIPECDLISNYLGCDTPEENQPYLQEAASSIGLAYTGAARRPSFKLNLLPPEMRAQQTGWVYVPAALLGIAIIALLLALTFREMAQQRIYIRSLDREIAKNEGPVARVQALRSEAEAMEKRITAIEKILGKRDMNLEVLRELTNILPMDTYMTMYNNQEGKITIAGSSNSAVDLVQKLEKSPLLKDVIQRGSTYKNAQNGKDNFNFEMKLER
jgi:Tfp pilus assembly protein PilN